MYSYMGEMDLYYSFKDSFWYQILSVERENPDFLYSVTLRKVISAMNSQYIDNSLNAQ